MVTLLNVAMVYMAYENIIGLWVTITNRESAYVPPTLIYAKAREKHMNWRDNR